MSQNYNPSPDFVAKTMQRIYALEAKRDSFFERFIWSRPLRYLLAGSGTLFGILKAVPVF